jgi:TonB family protein
MRNIFNQTVVHGVLMLTLAVFVAIAPPAMAAQELDEQRKATKRVPPVYPPVAREARLSGTVKMVVVVTAAGVVKTVRTIGGNPVLVPAAEDAVKQWKFEVAKRETSSLVAISFEETR